MSTIWKRHRCTEALGHSTQAQDAEADSKCDVFFLYNKHDRVTYILIIIIVLNHLESLYTISLTHSLSLVSLCLCLCLSLSLSLSPPPPPPLKQLHVTYLFWAFLEAYYEPDRGCKSDRPCLRSQQTAYKHLMLLQKPCATCVVSACACCLCLCTHAACIPTWPSKSPGPYNDTCALDTLCLARLSMRAASAMRAFKWMLLA